VEGSSDVYCYSRLVAAAALPTQIEVRPAKDLPGGTGGKAKLLAYFRYLRRANSLCSTLGGKRTAVMFFLDKDVDDILRKRLRSPHLVYTDGYDMESYLYRFGDVPNAVAALIQQNPAAVTAVIPGDWTVIAAEAWRHWIHLCLLARVINVNVATNYSVSSQINAPCDAACDHVRYVARREAIRAATGLDVASFARIVRRLERTIVVRYQSGLHHTVFRGKWYAVFLRHWVSALTARTFSEEELSAILAASLPYDAPWSRQIRTRIGDVAQRCGLLPAA